MKRWLRGRPESVTGFMDDMVQESWMRVQRHPFDPCRGGLKAYLESNVSGACIDFLRTHTGRRRCRSVCSLDEDFDAEGEAGVQCADHWAGDFAPHVCTLSSTMQRVLQEMFERGRTCVEIAHEMGIAPVELSIRVQVAGRILANLCGSTAKFNSRCAWAGRPECKY